MHIAQFNAGKTKNSLDHPSMSGFMDNLDLVNDLARNWPGFVWKLQDDTGHSAFMRNEKYPGISVNLSVWDTIESLEDYLKNSEHHRFYAQRRNWFHKQDEASSVIWWVEPGYEPTAEEGWEKLELLREVGPSKDAFTFLQRFPADQVSA